MRTRVMTDPAGPSASAPVSIIFTPTLDHPRRQEELVRQRGLRFLDRTYLEHPVLTACRMQKNIYALAL